MRQRYAKPWKLNFPEDRRVADKGDRRAAHATRKVRAAGDTRQIKEQRRHIVRGKLGHLPKDDSEAERGEKRLEDVPERHRDRSAWRQRCRRGGSPLRGSAGFSAARAKH